MIDEPWLSIGQLAGRLGTTARALRHYDRLGLFKPADVDPDTGTRRYTHDQIGDITLIVRLRSVDVSLKAIRACLAERPGSVRDTAVGDLLSAQRTRLEARLTRLRTTLHRLDHMITEEPMTTTDDNVAVDHRGLAVATFNETWTYLEKEDRTVAEDDAMLYTTFASRYHWAQVGEPKHFARGEWQISRVYSALRRAEEATYHARRCLEICQENGIADWDIAFAYEALTRAAAIGGDLDAAKDWARQSFQAAEAIADEADRKLLLTDLSTIEGIR